MTNSTRWRKSSYSGGTNNDCVEIDLGEATRLRDTKNRDAGTLTVTDTAFGALLTELKSGRTDLPR